MRRCLVGQATGSSSSFKQRTGRTCALWIAASVSEAVQALMKQKRWLEAMDIAFTSVQETDASMLSLSRQSTDAMLLRA